MQEGVMRLHKRSREIDPAELFKFMEETKQINQPPEGFDSTEEYEEEIEGEGPDTTGARPDLPLNQAAEESWEDLEEDFGEVSVAEDSRSRATGELAS
jgi:hypothetical protein